MQCNRIGSCAGHRVGRLFGISTAALISGAMILAPVGGAARVRDEGSAISERTVDRARVEQLQRWVSGGHADWCKDARLVASEELWRLAPDFSGDGFELNAVDGAALGNAGRGSRATFEWVPSDGRAVYRLTVERFSWLLPIAKDADSIVWVPVSVAIRAHE